MKKPLHFPVRPHPVTAEMRWRHRYTILTALTTVALLGWGAFVTSINAGLAVPDWPSSFNSYDPFNPWPQWWTLTPVLAEHGHRLLGALVGVLTVGLALWTWRYDPRRWMRRLGFGVLALVILQGVLGGLRVVLISLDLAVVHACVAQIYFSTIVAMALFTSRSWLQAAGPAPDAPEAGRLRRLAGVTVLALYVQIILGALLRHPGTGIDTTLVLTHIAGALVATGCILATFRYVRRHFRHQALLHRAAWVVVGLLTVQFTLGLLAYFVTLNDAGILQPSNVQVVVNTTHMVVGALLMASAVGQLLLALRRPALVAPTESAKSRILQQPVPAGR